MGLVLVRSNLVLKVHVNLCYFILKVIEINLEIDRGKDHHLIAIEIYKVKGENFVIRYVNEGNTVVNVLDIYCYFSFFNFIDFIVIVVNLIELIDGYYNVLIKRNFVLLIYYGRC